MTTTTIHFIRHGVVHNPKEMYYGRLSGFGLSDEGLDQARAAAQVLSEYPIEAVYCSPLQRAVETAREIAHPLDLDLRYSDLLLEAYTPFDGQPLQVVAERNWDVYSGTEAPYEQPEDILERASAFVEAARTKFRGRQVVAVSHADVIAFMMLWSMGQPVTAQQKDTLYEDYLGCASITSFLYESRREDEAPAMRYCMPYE